MSPDRSLDRLVARQHGAFSLQQARQAGFTDAMVSKRLSTGSWIRLAPSVYALASARPTWERQLTAAVLGHPQALVSGASAAHLLGFEGFRIGRPEITVPVGGNARSQVAKVSRCRWFEELGTIRMGGLLVTNVPETVVKLAERLSPIRLEALVDCLLIGHRVKVVHFEPIKRRLAGSRMRGTAKLYPILDQRAPDAWEPPLNELERRLDRLVDHPAVPSTSPQHPLRADHMRMIVDRYIAPWRVILEADGRRWHTRQADFERDRARDNAAAAAGEVVLRFTWRMLTSDFEGCRQTLLATGAVRSGTS